MKELADFIRRVNDMSTLTKSPRDKRADSDYSEDIEQQVNEANKGMNAS